MEKKKKKLGLLPKLIIAIALGLIVGFACQNFGDAGELIIQIGATYNSIFGNFLNFCIPLIIIGFVVPGIADLGDGAGKTLAATTGVAYLSTVIAGTLALWWILPCSPAWSMLTCLSPMPRTLRRPL